MLNIDERSHLSCNEIFLFIIRGGMSFTKLTSVSLLHAGPQQVKGCILADLAQHLLKAYDAEQETQSPSNSQGKQRICDSAAHFGQSHNSSRQPAGRPLGKASTAAQQEMPAAAAAAAAIALRGDAASDASEEISTCSEMQSSGNEGDDGGDTQSDNSMRGHSTVGADTAEVMTPHCFSYIITELGFGLLHLRHTAQGVPHCPPHTISFSVSEEMPDTLPMLVKLTLPA